jgi:hypothetical protein
VTLYPGILIVEEDERHGGSRYLADTVKTATRLELLDSMRVEIGTFPCSAQSELHILLLENNDMLDEHYKVLLEIIPEKPPKLRLLGLVSPNLRRILSSRPILNFVQGRLPDSYLSLSGVSHDPQCHSVR